MAFPAQQYFSTLAHKRHNFRKKIFEHKIMFLFALQLLSEKFLILRKIEQYVVKIVYWPSFKVPNILVRL